MRPQPLVIPLCALLLSACQQVPVQDESSPRSRIPPGSTITLNKPLTIPAGTARVFLQGGEVKAKTGLNQYHPHCNFEVRSVSDGNLRIEAGRFIVIAVHEDEEEVVHRSLPQRYAALQLAGDPLDIVASTSRFVRYRLNSERQPGVMRLTCHGGFGEPWQVDYPGIGDIRKALGEWVSLELASGG